MSVPTTADWDESSPAGSSAIALGDDRIREMKAQVREIMEIDHDFPSSATATGYHKKVTLQEQANLGTGAVGTTILGSQTVAGRGELVYTNEDDTDIQLTRGAYMGSESTNIAANTIGCAALYLSGVNIINLIYPVGSIYANYAVSTNPGTLFGVGTWVAIEEEVIAGYKAGSAEFGAIGSYAGGEKTHTLSAAESGLPAHTHTATVYDSDGALGNFDAAQAAGGTATATVNANSAAAASSAHNNIQPTYVAYLWRRTA